MEALQVLKAGYRVSMGGDDTFVESVIPERLRARCVVSMIVFVGVVGGQSIALKEKAGQPSQLTRLSSSRVC